MPPNSVASPMGSNPQQMGGPKMGGMQKSEVSNKIHLQTVKATGTNPDLLLSLSLEFHDQHQYEFEFCAKQQ